MWQDTSKLAGEASPAGGALWGSESERQAFGQIWPLWYGDHGVRDHAAAVTRLKQLADQGYAPAQFVLGLAHYDGDGVRRDYAKSFDYFSAAAAQGYPGAEGMVGNFYITAKPAHSACAYDPAEAARWHRLAAEHGNAGAQYNLAFSYWTGRGVDQDPLEAFVWASLSAHCSAIRNRMAEVQRDQASAALDPEQRAEADRRIEELKSTLPFPWSEPLTYWKSLAQRAGVLEADA